MSDDLPAGRPPIENDLLKEVAELTSLVRSQLADRRITLAEAMESTLRFAGVIANQMRRLGLLDNRRIFRDAVGRLFAAFWPNVQLPIYLRLVSFFVFVFFRRLTTQQAEQHLS